MTDKVQKIRKEVERLMDELIQEKEKGFGSDVDDACILELQNVLTYIDSLQEEPVSNNHSALLPCIYNKTLEERVKYCKYCSAACEGRVKEPVSEDLEKAAVEAFKQIVDSDKNNFLEIFKAGAEWKKQQTISKACKWIDKNAAKYLVDRFVGSTRVVGIDTSITEDFRKDMED